VMDITIRFIVKGSYRKIKNRHLRFLVCVRFLKSAFWKKNWP